MTTTKNHMKHEEVFQCSKCGACLTTCPVYDQLREETAAPRAKIQLIRHYAEKRLPPSEYLNDIVNRCLMCGTCTTNCPSGVRHAGLFMRMRAGMAADYGEDWHLKVLYHFLSHEQQLKFAAKFARFGRNVVMEKVAREVKIGNIPVKRLPKLNAGPFRDQVPEISNPVDGPIGTVLYFTGCGTNHAFDAIGHAVVKVLTTMGFRVEIPKGQVCCGLPMFAHGSMSTARKNIETNISLFNRDGISAVVTDCATCGSALKSEYPHVLEELDRPVENAQKLATRVQDVSEFILANYARLAPKLNPNAARETVTYHAPCHLRNAQGVKAEVIQLLSKLPHIDYVQSADYDSCCGGGGTFFYDYPDISHQIVSKKIENAMATDANYWVTGCPGCTVNLSGNLPDDAKISMIHPVQLISRALKAYES
ncbi:MAG: (Fe-S)-binding protein [Deltaproteobacteria bacterium]|nr:(Fe-S)-binding protein [Deltaproteobacteria bacterium]